MKFKKNLRYFHKAAGVLFLLIAGSSAACAQQNDSLQRQTIDIYNVYQPELRNAAKLNITASLPSFDTTRPRLVYNIPALNLYFTYQPVPLRPLAMGKDSLQALQNNFIKAGFGNYSTPLIQVGLGSGRNDKFNYSLFFNHLSSKGDIENQQFSHDNLHAYGQIFSGNNEFHAAFGYDRNAVNYYGYDHDTVKLDKEDVRQTYNTVSLSAGFGNTRENKLGFNYHPELKLVNFFDANNQTESTFYIKVPVEKRIIDDISIVADFIGDFSGFSGRNDIKYNNIVMSIHPALLISKPGFVLRAGLNPTWSKNKFFLLPDIVNETNLIKDKLILSSGWISYVVKNSFQHIAGENPFVYEYPDLLNTRVEEKYTGIKGTIDNHFTYNTKFAFVEYNNQPLFLNDSLYGNKFNILNEENLKAYHLHGELGYIEEEKFQFKLSGDWFNYFKETTAEKPWGLVPFQASLYMQYIIAKRFRLHADAFILSGSFYQDNGDDFKTNGAFDVSAGASYEISKNFGIWINANNLLNSHYERWHNYPSLGLNVLGGILIKF